MSIIWPSSGGGETDKDLSYFVHVGTSPWERVYVAGQGLIRASTVQGLAANTVYALPFVSGRGGTLDRLLLEVTTAVAGNARLGIYDATSDTNIYPNVLIVDGGAIDVSTTGVKSATISQALSANKVYWMVLLADTTATLRAIGNTEISSYIIGVKATLGSTLETHLRGTLTYGALPATFPTGIAWYSGGQCPVMARRYSA